MDSGPAGGKRTKEKPKVGTFDPARQERPEQISKNFAKKQCCL